MATMTTSTHSPYGPSKRPRLSLQTASMSPLPSASARVSFKPPRPFAIPVPSTLQSQLQSQLQPQLQSQSPTRPELDSTPRSRTPLTAIDTSLQAQALAKPAASASGPRKNLSVRVPPPVLKAFTWPETPLTARPVLPDRMELPFRRADPLVAPQQQPSEKTASTGDKGPAKPFEFVGSGGPQTTPRTSSLSRRNTLSRATAAPYVHPRSLHSILRNSPLPQTQPAVDSLELTSPPLSGSSLSAGSSASTSASTSISTSISTSASSSNSTSPSNSNSPSRPASKRVCYDSPLTQTITNSLYTVSHIDLLLEDSGLSPSTAEPAAALTLDELRDGGHTPGPFEDVQRRMTCLGTGPAAVASSFSSSFSDQSATPRPSTSSGNGSRKRKRKERKCRWVWTIGAEEYDGDDDDVGGAIAALRAAEAASQNGANGTTGPIYTTTMTTTTSSADATATTTTPTISIVAAAAPTVDTTTATTTAGKVDVYVDSPTPTSSMASFDDADDEAMDIDSPYPLYPHPHPHPYSHPSPANFSGTQPEPDGTEPPSSPSLSPSSTKTPTADKAVPDPDKLCPGDWHGCDSPLRTGGEHFFE